MDSSMVSVGSECHEEDHDDASTEQPVDLRRSNFLTQGPNKESDEAKRAKTMAKMMDMEMSKEEEEEEGEGCVSPKVRRLHDRLSLTNAVSRSEELRGGSREVKKRRLNALLHKKFRPESKYRELSKEMSEEEQEHVEEAFSTLRARRVQELQAILASSSRREEPKDEAEHCGKEVGHRDGQEVRGDGGQVPRLRSIQSMVSDIRKPVPVAAVAAMHVREESMRSTLDSNLKSASMMPNMMSMPTTPTKSTCSPSVTEDGLKTQLLQLHLAQMAAFNSLVVSPASMLTSLDSETANKTLLQQYGYFSLLLKRIQGLQQELVEKLMLCCHQRNAPQLLAKNENAEEALRAHKRESEENENRLRVNAKETKSMKRPDISVFQWHPSKSVKECLLRSPPLSSMSRPRSSMSESSDTQPRKRAPRAMTGRYVRTGPGASKEILAALRRKLLGQERPHHHQRVQ